MKEASQSLLPYFCVTSICETRGRQGSTSNFSRAEQVGPSGTLLPLRRQSREPENLPSSHTFRESFFYEPQI